jgi:hypothetical protein
MKLILISPSLTILPKKNKQKRKTHLNSQHISTDEALDQ